MSSDQVSITCTGLRKRSKEVKGQTHLCIKSWICYIITPYPIEGKIRSLEKNAMCNNKVWKFNQMTLYITKVKHSGTILSNWKRYPLRCSYYLITHKGELGFCILQLWSCKVNWPWCTNRERSCCSLTRCYNQELTNNE